MCYSCVRSDWPPKDIAALLLKLVLAFSRLHQTHDFIHSVRRLEIQVFLTDLYQQKSTMRICRQSSRFSLDTNRLRLEKVESNMGVESRESWLRSHRLGVGKKAEVDALYNGLLTCWKTFQPVMNCQ